MIRAQSRPLALPRLHPLQTLLRWIALDHQRRALSRLDATRLNDIGVTRDQADAEAGRVPWDAPANWRI